MISWSVKLLRATTAITIAGIFGGIYGHLTKKVEIKTLNYHQNRDEFSWEDDITLTSGTGTKETFQRYLEKQGITDTCNKILVSLNRNISRERCETWLEEKMEDMVYAVMAA